MIKFSNVKVGDYVLVNNEGDVRRGQVKKLKHGENQVCVDNGVQEFWYETNQLEPLPISDAELKHLKFSSEEIDAGKIKYSKGAFRMVAPSANDFSSLELWYRDEKRHITTPITLNELQNHFYALTKVHLDDANF